MMLARVVIGISAATAIFGWIMWRMWSVERAETDPRHRRRILLGLGLIYVVSAVIGVAAALRPPRNQRVLVAYIQGDVFSHSTSAKVWKYGQSIECVLASGSHQFPPDKRGDVLLCGEQTLLAWSQVWLRSDTQDQVYEAARTFDVTFHATIRGRRGFGSSWWCKRLSQGIDCE